MRVRNGKNEVEDHGPVDGRSWYDPRKSPRQRDEEKRADNLRRRFGISSVEYDRLLSEQGGVCGICRKPDTVMGRKVKSRRLAVDHDHRTGGVRGLLCQRCNVLCGLLGDDPTWAVEFGQRMAVYFPPLILEGGNK